MSENKRFDKWKLKFEEKTGELNHEDIILAHIVWDYQEREIEYLKSLIERFADLNDSQERLHLEAKNIDNRFLFK